MSITSPALDASRTVERAYQYLAGTQRERGCWVAEVKWCTVLVSQHVIISYITGQEISQERTQKYIKYLRYWFKDEGGWGMHWESPPYVFTTTLAYIACRLMGIPADDEMVKRSLKWLHAHGGPLNIPTWGKFWLALLNLYDWQGVNPITPELWALPSWIPIHPRQMYNHTRLIYLGMSYLYGRRFTAPLTLAIEQLRRELFDQPYELIDFTKARCSLAETDVFTPPTPVLRVAYEVLYRYERIHSRRLRSWTLDDLFERILFELRSTRYACVSPVNGLLNTLALWDRRHPEFGDAYRGIDYWCWEDDEEGLRINGAHSHTWDTGFAVQAISECPEETVSGAPGVLRKAASYLKAAQMKTELEDYPRWYRDRRFGGWCFSDEHHCWPVSDCTGEALSAILSIHRYLPQEEQISEHMLRAAAEFILSRQNRDGGWGSYERKRASLILEQLNPSEMFGNCMVEHSYVECTASCIAALVRFRGRRPHASWSAVDTAIKRGREHILKVQRPDGSWEGFWGVNFTYGIMYAVEGLRAAGLSPQAPAIESACRWLLARQKADGGWGEHYSSCLTHRYVEHPCSQVIMTAWALMTLLAGDHAKWWGAIERGVALLQSRQLQDGNFPQEGVAGVFFHTAMHHYCLYKNYFPLWALGRYERIRREPSAWNKSVTSSSHSLRL